MITSLCPALGGLQDQTDEVQQQPGWLQDGDGEADGESTPLPAVPLPGQGGRQPASPAAAGPAEDLLSLSETPRAGAEANGGPPPGQLRSSIVHLPCRWCRNLSKRSLL